MVKNALTLLAVLTATACGQSGTPITKDGDKPLPPPPPPLQLVEPDASKHAVLIVDDGFDLQDDVFQKKVVATYTLNCVERSNAIRANSFEEAKRQLLAQLSKSDDRCRIEKSMRFSPSKRFKEIAKYQKTWNQAILEKNEALIRSLGRETALTIATILDGESGKYNYHGTATASSIAYQNDAIQLVVVQKKLAMHAAANASSEFACIRKADIDEELRFYKDVDIQNAYINRPLSLEEQGIESIIRDHNINLVNLSLGRMTRPGYEKLAKKHGCAAVDLRDYFKTVTDLEAKRKARLWESGLISKNHLTIQAAGNDTVEINDGTDAFDCSDRAHNLLMVGASNVRGQKAEFTNSGNCVDAYTLGHQVVVAAPQKFLSITSGTSFSTPLLLRYVSQTFSRNMAPQDIYKAVVEQAGESKFMPESIWPREIAWENKGSQIVAFNLTQGLFSAFTTTQTQPVPDVEPNYAEGATLPRLW